MAFRRSSAPSGGDTDAVSCIVPEFGTFQTAEGGDTGGSANPLNTEVATMPGRGGSVLQCTHGPHAATVPLTHRPVCRAVAFAVERDTAKCAHMPTMAGSAVVATRTCMGPGDESPAPKSTATKAPSELIATTMPLVPSADSRAISPEAGSCVTCTHSSIVTSSAAPSPAAAGKRNMECILGAVAGIPCDPGDTASTDTASLVIPSLPCSVAPVTSTDPKTLGRNATLALAAVRTCTKKPPEARTLVASIGDPQWTITLPTSTGSASTTATFSNPPDAHEARQTPADDAQSTPHVPSVA